jgi:superfamily II DNA or RNA helicase
MGEVLRDGDARLSEVRAEGHPDAGGLVIASDQEHARAIAARLGAISGERPELVMSDEPDASRRIADFAASERRWLVSVLMVSEGVDIPRLRVGVYATAARTELFFRQVVGRFIRTTPGGPRRQMSYLLMPADPRLKALAREIELERRHALDLSPAEEDEGEEFDEPVPERSETGEGFAALSSGDAELDEAIMSGTALQLFPTEDPADAAKKKTAALAAPKPAPKDPEPERETAYAARERLRGERSRLVGDLARRTNKSHREIQSRINRETRVRSVASATIEQLERGNELLRRELWR